MKRGLVLTTGVFDIIHPGHIRLLKFARQLGNALVVGINSDDSVKRVRGKLPVMSAEDRKTVLMAIRYVDDVRIFHEDDPSELIRQIHPAIFVKGPDYAGKDTPELEVLKRFNVEYIVPNWPKTKSSTDIKRRLAEVATD